MGDKVEIHVRTEQVQHKRKQTPVDVVVKTLVNWNAKYQKPHQGAKEKARRLKQLEKE